MQKKILLVGESWTSTSTHVKGFDQFATATWHTGATDFLAALAESPYAITYMPAHAAATDFPLTLEALQEWDAIILSDIGANTLLLHPDIWIPSRWEMPAGSTILSARRWKTGVFMAADPAI